MNTFHSNDDIMEILNISNICKSYNGVKIIENINGNLKKGELVSILGVSGSGKTTLFNILSGIEKPDSGVVMLKGEDITGVSGKVSYMQQKDLLLPFKTVLDNVCIPLLLSGKKKKDAREEAAAYFEEFGIGGSEKKYPSQISGGMRQRAALLRSYLFSGEIMLLDEPFSALDAITKENMHGWYKKISKKHNTSSFFITHDINEAIMLSDRIYIMAGKPGKLTKEISVEYDGERDSEFAMSQEFNDYKRLILEEIR